MSGTAAASREGLLGQAGWRNCRTYKTKVALGGMRLGKPLNEECQCQREWSEICVGCALTLWRGGGLPVAVGVVTGGYKLARAIASYQVLLSPHGILEKLAQRRRIPYPVIVRMLFSPKVISVTPSSHPSPLISFCCLIGSELC